MKQEWAWDAAATPRHTRPAATRRANRVHSRGRKCQQSSITGVSVACKDEFEVAERSGDSADGRNRDRPAKTLAMPLSNSSKGDFGDEERDTKVYAIHQR